MITIREATTEDIQALSAIGIETYREHFSDIWTATGMQDFLNQDFSFDALQRSLQLPAAHCWLLASDAEGRVVGFAKVNWSKPMPVSAEVGAELQKIYFLKSQAGNGYGKQLLQVICQMAKEREERFVALDVLRSNANAQRFYERFGFEAVGEIPFSTDKAEIGMVVMRCDLCR